MADRYGERDDDAGKIFLGGLSWETTDDDLHDYFGKFGRIVDATVKTDPGTGRSKGFGFVVFADASSVDKVLASGSLTLQGRSIEPQKARGRSSGGGRGGGNKIFVGGVDGHVSESAIRDYFSTFGSIEDIHMPVDRDTNERRPFVFVTFSSDRAADDACNDRDHFLGGKDVTVRMATPKNEFGGRGGGGRGRGGRGFGGGSGGYGGGGYYDNGGRRSGGRGGGYDSGSRYQPYGRY